MTLCPKCHAILPTHNPWCPDVQPPPVYSNSTNAPADARACGCRPGGREFREECDPIPADVTREPTDGQGLDDLIADAIHAVTGACCGEGDGDTDCYRAADAVLAIPELAALITDREQYARERAAQELRAAATSALNGSGGRPLGWLLARADALSAHEVES